MNLQDAALMVLSESADHPAVASVAQAVYERLTHGDPVDYRVLNDLIGQASGKGVLQALAAKYDPVAYEAIITPILKEIDRQAPVPPRRRPAEEDDPLRAAGWPPRESAGAAAPAGP
jgi:hypothetical protein